MSDREDLIEELRGWIDKGSSGQFSSVADGMQEFVDAMTTYCKKGADEYGNKIVGFTGSEFVAAVSSLSISSTPSQSASAMATGISNSFTGKTLGTLNMPPGANAVIDNSIIVPPPVSDIQDEIEPIIDADFELLKGSAETPAEAKENIDSKIAEMWADVIINALEATEWLMNYTVPGVPNPVPMVSQGTLEV